MKVLKKGRPQKGWSVEAVCTGKGNGGGGCGAKLLVEQADLYKTYNSDYTGDTETYVTFTCACCGVETDISSCPWDLQRKLPDKSSWKKKNAQTEMNSE